MLEFYKNPEEKFEIRFSLALPSDEKMNRSGIRHRATKSRGKEDGDGSGSSHASESKPGHFETNSSSLKYGGEEAPEERIGRHYSARTVHATTKVRYCSRSCDACDDKSLHRSITTKSDCHSERHGNYNFTEV